MTNQRNNAMVAQVESLPDLIRRQFDELDMRVRVLLDHEECLSVKRVIVVGCGDSHMAGLGAELAFEQIAGIPAEPMTAMQGGRYAAPYFPTDVPRNPLVLGISVSGTVARVREAVNLSRQRGALTVAVTGNPSSPLAEASEKVLDCSIPDFPGPHTPGVRSYRMSLLALYLLAIRLGEVRDRLSQDEANAMRRELRQSADAIEATVSAANAAARDLAAEFAGRSSFVFVGDGPNYASALFSAAKVIEAAGRHAMGQDTEEWAHLQYFVSVEADTPTFVISPGRRAHDRAAEILLSMTRVGRTTVAVTPEGDADASPHANRRLPVVGDVREAFSPMVYAVPGELFSAHLADAVGESYFRTSNPAYGQGNDIRISKVLEVLEP